MAQIIRTRWITRQFSLRRRQGRRSELPSIKRNRGITSRGGELALILAILISAHGPLVRAADPVVEINPPNEAAASEADVLPESEPQVQALFPVLISLGAHTGYDSNPGTGAGGQGAWFVSEDLTLSYDRLRGPTEIDLVAGVGAVQRFGQDSDVNAFLNLAATHAVSPRLSLSGTIDSAYRTEPDFSSDVGLNQRNGNYFTSTDQISAAYQWSERLSTVTSYSFRLIRYENSSVASFTDREEHTFGEELRFDLRPQTVLVADYRFLLVNYDSFPRDSTTHFLLAGVEQSFTPRLGAQARTGVSFRSFEQDEDSVDPEFEGSIDYALARDSSLSWSVRYSVEEPSVQQSLSRTTLRTGLQLRYLFTARISSALGFFYHHDEDTGRTATTDASQAFSTDAYDLSLSARYQFSRHWDLDASFERSDVSSEDPAQSYTRNRYSIGVNFTF